jgi:hypothetical protein
MDPQTQFYEQVDLFMDKFQSVYDWAIRKDKKNNIITLIPPEWVMDSQFNGVSIQFTINTLGELVFSIGIETPIVLEQREAFKIELHRIMTEKGLFERHFEGFSINLKQRGKFLKKSMALLSDSHNEMLRHVELVSILREDIKSLLNDFDKKGKLATPGKQKNIGSQNVGSIKQKDDLNNEIIFEDGESEYEIEYNTNRKILTQKTEYSIEYLYKLGRRGRLDLQPNFQRQFVWDILKASSLIESLLLDVPIPPIYLSESDGGEMTVIDGQQRLGSIFAFIDGKFLDGKKFALKGLKVLRDLNGKQYKHISTTYQDKFDAASISTIIIKKESDSELKFDIYERLNTGSVKLNDQELRNCIYRGVYLEQLKKLSNDKDFKYIMGLKTADKRMKDVEYVLRFAAFYHQTYLNYSKSRNMKNFLNLEMKNNQHADEEIMAELEEAFKRAVQINKSLFGNRSFRRIKLGDPENHNASWKNTTIVSGALYDLMMVSFLDYDKNMIFRNLDALREGFICLITENIEFVDLIEKWTNSYPRIKRRFEIFNEVISAILKDDTKQERCFTIEFKERLFKLSNRCAICNQAIYMIEDAAVDHIEQYWLGGKTIPDNARLVHRHCNLVRRRKEGIQDTRSGEINDIGSLVGR